LSSLSDSPDFALVLIRFSRLRPRPYQILQTSPSSLSDSPDIALVLIRFFRLRPRPYQILQTSPSSLSDSPDFALVLIRFSRLRPRPYQILQTSPSSLSDSPDFAFVVMLLWEIHSRNNKNQQYYIFIIWNCWFYVVVCRCVVAYADQFSLIYLLNSVDSITLWPT
jgi:hypothetical protein